jgi:hypothetical protein
MALFVVTAGPDEKGEGFVRVEKATRKDAMETAVGLLGQGFKKVLIAVESGRVYTPTEFVSTFAERD